MNTLTSSVTRSTTFLLEGTLIALRDAGQQLPASLKAFQLYFPGNRLELLTVAEYKEVEAILSKIVENPYSLETLVGFMDAARALLERKFQKNEYNYTDRLSDDIQASVEYDDETPVFQDNLTRFDRSKTTSEFLKERRGQDIANRINRILSPLQVLIDTLRKGESIAEDEAAKVIEGIEGHLDGSRYAKTSAIKLRQSSQGNNRHLPIVAADLFYQSKAYVACSERMNAHMGHILTQAQELLKKYQLNIRQGDPFVSMRIEGIFSHDGLQENEVLHMKALYRDMRESFGRMCTIMDQYKSDGMGVNPGVIENFLSKYHQFQMHVEELQTKIQGLNQQGDRIHTKETHLLPLQK